jgi:hypothetical protein
LPGATALALTPQGHLGTIIALKQMEMDFDEFVVVHKIWRGYPSGVEVFEPVFVEMALQRV